MIQISNPSDRKKIKEQIDEAVIAKMKISDQQAIIKDIITIIHEDYDIDKKQIRTAIAARFKRNKSEIIQSTEEFDFFYDSIFTDETSDIEDDSDATNSVTSGEE